MKNLNLNFDLSKAPTWLVIALLLASFMAELATSRPAPPVPSITLDQCASACALTGGAPRRWSTTECVCWYAEELAPVKGSM